MLVLAQESRVQAPQFSASVRCRELPVDLVGGPVPFGLPGVYFSARFQGVADPTVQALPARRPEFALGDVGPTAVRGRVVDFQPLGQRSGLGRLESLVERRGRMGAEGPLPIEIVHHQNDLLRLGVALCRRVLQGLGPVHLRPPLRDADETPTS